MRWFIKLMVRVLSGAKREREHNEARTRTYRGRKADVWHYFKKYVNIHILVQQCACAIP